MFFRAPFTRASRSILCLLIALGLAIAIRAEIVTQYINPATRWGWLIATIVMELILLGGLQRIWVVGLIVDEDAGITVRNFRGDLHYRRTEIKEVIRRSDFSGCHVALRLKTGEEMGLDGVTWLSPSRTDRAVAEISRALGMEQADGDDVAA